MKLVLCEGGDDLEVVRCLCSARGFTGITVEPFGGKDNLSNVVEALPKRPEFTRLEAESLAIILDADANHDAAWQKTRDAVQKAFGVTLAQPGIFAGNTPRIAGFIVSGPDGDGMLEDLCLHSVSDRPGYECLTEYFRCLAERTETKDYHSKGKFRAWMASQSDYELYVGKAATKGYLPWASPAFDPLAQFLSSV